jgi:hypothetical protein
MQLDGIKMAGKNMTFMLKTLKTKNHIKRLNTIKMGKRGMNK